MLAEIGIRGMILVWALGALVACIDVCVGADIPEPAPWNATLHGGPKRER